jgi:hypothetical protein
LKNNTPFIIDDRYDLNYNLAVNITKEDYEKTFVSVVTETLTLPNTLFFSEKIWKPIMVGHPFLLLGNQHSLRYLKDLGYKTFDKWFNEDYDSKFDSDTRARMIARTESLMVTNASKYTQSELMPIVMEKTWVHDHPKMPRDWHIALSGKTIDLDKKFNANGYMMKHPGDPAGGATNNINCKCTMLTKAKYDEENNIIYK